ncbi:hypothetical protein [Amycolatopsis sp. NPDC051128]|uniref:hypothetical protein n=1 Tax=Amycolatopsis sp. NPDC051128 TaxID=3155412 RepID=UPI00341CF770
MLASLEPLSGNSRQATLVALRSLFRMAKMAGVVFRDPSSRIRIGAAAGAILQPLPDEEVWRTVAAAVRPADPLILALATIHAARGHAIRLRSWLAYRRATWAVTPNPHLLINRRTAAATTEVGHGWLSKACRPCLNACAWTVTFDEALTEPDPTGMVQAISRLM